MQERRLIDNPIVIYPNYFNRIFGMIAFDIICYVYFKYYLNTFLIIVFSIIVLIINIIYILKKWNKIEIDNNGIKITNSMGLTLINFHEIVDIQYKFIKSSGMCLVIRYNIGTKKKIIFNYKYSENDKLFMIFSENGFPIDGYTKNDINYRVR